MTSDAGDWQSVVHGSYEGLNDLFKVMFFLQNDEFQMEECLEKLWNSRFFSFFWKHDQVWAFNAFSRKTSVLFHVFSQPFLLFSKKYFWYKMKQKEKKEFFGGIWGKATALDTTVQDSLSRSNSF